MYLQVSVAVIIIIFLIVCTFDMQVYFEVNVLEKLQVSMPETETKPHVVRLGWSVDRANLQVSEMKIIFI